MEITTKSPEETERFGQEFVDYLKKKNSPLIIALSGNLGSGKTIFTQGLSKGLKLKNRVISPTFILVRQYKIELPEFPFQNLYHADLYRLEENIENEIINLGIKDAWSENGNLVVIEWAEKAKNIIPEDAIWINFSYIDKNDRKIIVSE